MKRYLPLLLLFGSTSAQATIRTVSNFPATLAQFSTIQAAINASNSGDTIYVHGSPLPYFAFNINNKQIFLFGPGRNPDIPSAYKASIGSGPQIQLSGTAASGTEFHGFLFAISIVISSPNPSNIKFIRNEFATASIIMNNTEPYSGFIIRGNYFHSASTIEGHSSAGGFYQDFMLENNVFRTTFSFSVRSLVNCTNVFFNHNLVFNSASHSNSFFLSCSNLVLTNNIFNEQNLCYDLTNSNFINNITWNPPDSSVNETPWACSGNMDGGGNIADMNPMMADQVAVDDGSAGPLHNFTIASGPANNSGSDGKDMGVLFDPVGGLNWNHSRNSRLPSIVSLLVANPVLGAGNSLNVTINARKNE
jgi:hypothetical protein